MYKKILVPTDGSESSKQALINAVNLAKLSDAEVMVLHVTLTPKAYWGYNLAYGQDINPEELQKLGNEIIEETLREVDIADLPITKRIMSGYPAQEIINIAQEENVDMIVMGSHGHGPFTSAFLGSVSQKVLTKAQAPVMIIKDPNAYLF